MIPQGFRDTFWMIRIWNACSCVREGGYVCEFLFLIINVYIFFVLLEETKTEMRSVLSSSPCLYLCRTWHAASWIFWGRRRFFPLPASHLTIGWEEFLSSQGKGWRWAGKLPARRVGLPSATRRTMSMRVGFIGLDYRCHFCLAAGTWEVSHTCGNTCRDTYWELPDCLYA